MPEGTVLVGTCNWSDHTDFYPPGMKPTDRLPFYARYFPIVEIDSTFYHLQPARNFERWAMVTPPDFVFNVKAYRELTWHDREKQPEDSTFRAFDQALQPLRDAGKLKAVHFQFPPWFTAREENAEYIAHARSYFPKDRFAVEFRHKSWFTGEQTERTLELMKQNDAAHVIVDAPQIGSGTVPAVLAVTDPSLAIVRFHGRNRATWYRPAKTTGDRFDYLYSQQELAEWVPDIRKLGEQAQEVHLMLNNNHADYAVQNARDLMTLLELPHPTPDDLFAEKG
jgi:uncharacterized protein YecE (DUF72 family)